MIASCSVELRERTAQNIVLTEAWNKLAWTLFECFLIFGRFLCRHQRVRIHKLRKLQGLLWRMLFNQEVKLHQTLPDDECQQLGSWSEWEEHLTKTSTVQSKDGTERSICESNLKTCESNFKFHEMTKCFVCSGHSSNSLAMPDRFFFHAFEAWWQPIHMASLRRVCLSIFGAKNPGEVRFQFDKIKHFDFQRTFRECSGRCKSNCHLV